MTTTTNSSGITGRAATPGLPGAGLDVAVFVTCINDVMFPQTGVAVTKLLERLGCRVHFPKEQTCCAQITTNTGYFDESMGMVRSYVKAFGDYDYVAVFYTHLDVYKRQPKYFTLNMFSANTTASAIIASSHWGMGSKKRQ